MSAKALALRAMTFAREAHAGQARRYTGNPYVDHLAEVAGIVATVDTSAESIAMSKTITDPAMEWQSPHGEASQLLPTHHAST